MSTSDSCEDTASKSNNYDVCDVKIKLQNMSTADGVCEVNVMLHNMSTGDGAVSICANCGKESNDVNNVCNKCKKATYCNASCKKKHRKKHKKQCEEYAKLAAEQAAELHDEKLFKQPPSLYGDCPICFLRMPTLLTGCKYMVCCGKEICTGCCYASVYDNQGNKIAKKVCAFCRAPWHASNNEFIERMKKREEAGDAAAMFNFGVYHRRGQYGFPQDYTKELEFYHQAAELGYARAYTTIGYAYDFGEGVEVDKVKARYYYELAAMGGDVKARYNLGLEEEDAGNMEKALKHYLIAVRGGHSKSLTVIQKLYSNGLAKKENYMKALQSYQAYLGEIKSRQRDEAAAINRERYCYY